MSALCGRVRAGCVASGVPALSAASPRCALCAACVVHCVCVIPRNRLVTSHWMRRTADPFGSIWLILTHWFAAAQLVCILQSC